MCIGLLAREKDLFGIIPLVLAAFSFPGLALVRTCWIREGQTPTLIL